MLTSISNEHSISKSSISNVTLDIEGLTLDIGAGCQLGKDPDEVWKSVTVCPSPSPASRSASGRHSSPSRRSGLSPGRAERSLDLRAIERHGSVVYIPQSSEKGITDNKRFVSSCVHVS